MEDLKIALIQYDIQWENKSSNLSYIDQLLNTQYQGEDLIILPEMFSTGFSMNAQLHAESIEGKTMQQLLIWSSKFDCCISGSFICEQNETFTNKFVAVFPDGSFIDYDKKYLFSPANESEVYQAGEKISTFDIKGWTICPLICYDLRFPEWPRNVEDTLDLIVYAASWPKARIGHWDKLLAARAIENQCYSIGVNRTGSDGNGFEYNGGSVIKDYDGNSILDCNNETGYFRFELKADHLPYREKLNFLRDKKGFQFI